MILEGYIVISAIIAILCGVLSFRSLQRKTRMGIYVGMLLLDCAIIDIAYCCSVIIKDYFWFSAFSSIYFSGITFLVCNLCMFAVMYTDAWNQKVRSLIHYGIFGYAILDAIVMAINPFKEIVMHYVPNGQSFAVYSFDKLPLYHVHLIFSYFVILVTVVLFVHRIIYVPSAYKKKFLYVILAIMAIVLVNAMFLFMPEGHVIKYLDFSVLGYGFAGLVVYWNVFYYVERVLADGFKTTIFENIDEGIVLYDYEGHLLMYNRSATKMLSGIRLNQEISHKDFMSKCGLDNIKESGEHKSHAIQCYIESKRGISPLRCYYTKMVDKKNVCIGHLYIFADIAQETDILTGFHNWENFVLYASDNDEMSKNDTPVAVCDINGLSLINQMYGTNEGDQKIRNLATRIREVFPKTCYFVRGSEAHLVVICQGMTEAETIELLNEVRSTYDGSMQYAVSRIGYHSNYGVIETIRDAEKGMQAKKLLDKESIHSEMLTSLIRALEESDDDTEMHVQRTQKMGAMLGIRLGLSDVEQSNLALLCILHDIGKIGVPLEVLNKPGRLTDAEWKTIQTHVEKGYQIAKSSKDIEPIANMIRYHHERWDGKGYPDGLSQDSIPLLSRVISVVDAYDAMVNDRSYRKALPIEKARGELVRGAGTQFDPHIVSEYLALLAELDQDSEFVDVPGVYNEAHPTTELSYEESASTPHDPSKASGQASLPTREINLPKDYIAKNVHKVNYSRYLLDDQNVIVEVDANFETITGYTMEDVNLMHMTIADLLPEEDRTDYLMLVEEALMKKSQAFMEHRIRCKDGTNIHVFCYGRQYYDPTVRAGRSEIIFADVNKTHSVQIIQNVVQDKVRVNRQLWEDMAHRDRLTGLLNHSAFENEVSIHILKKDYRILFLMMDMDYFKEYNDTYGHRAGDDYLILMARTMEQAVRKQDLLCRMGGDEFAAALLLPKAFNDEAIVIRVEKVFTRISEELGKVQGGASISLGAVVSTPKTKTFTELYESADKALYQAKNSGKNQYVIFDGKKANQEDEMNQ